MHVRDYLRVNVTGLKIRYNRLPSDDSSSLYLDFGKRKSALPHESGLEADSFQSAMASTLNRLEVKLDELLGYMERVRHGMEYQHVGTVEDIGGGGLRVRSPLACPVGALLDLCIFAEYGNTRPVYAIGRVCWLKDRKAENEADDSAVSLLGIEFVEINEDDREALVRMVFHVERNRRQQETPSDP